MLGAKERGPCGQRVSIFYNSIWSDMGISETCCHRTSGTLCRSETAVRRYENDTHDTAECGQSTGGRYKAREEGGRENTKHSSSAVAGAGNKMKTGSGAQANQKNVATQHRAHALRNDKRHMREPYHTTLDLA